MTIIPEPREISLADGRVRLWEIKWEIDDSADARVRSEAYRICGSTPGGMPVHIHTADGDGEGYTLTIGRESVEISANGGAGAFYALQTLKQIRNCSEDVSCCTIKDSPGMKYRGFYQDITRGKIPKLDTLKSLVDLMASLKMNALQLYIEHTYEFKEYEHCRDRLGYISKEELRELEAYCRDRFITLEPSVSLFGHLYHLLSDERYKHLSEFPNYRDTQHYWVERMAHHTLNPLLDESFDVVKSLIDQYLDATDCDRFNICCDETFDLGKGVNAGKDSGRLYVDFVKKIIAYLNSKGKRVMMWGDIILMHEEYMEEIPRDVIFLNWEYSPEPDERKAAKISESGREQILCPGTSAWNELCEPVEIEEKNIINMARYAYKYNALGILNTNWGDYGNICSLSMAYYGLCLGAAAAWNIGTAEDSGFREKASVFLYGDKRTVGLKARLTKNHDAASWFRCVRADKSEITKQEYENKAAVCADVAEKVKKLEISDADVKAELVNAAEGYELITKWSAALDGYAIECDVDFDSWVKEYAALWEKRNKPGELEEVLKTFSALQGKNRNKQ